MLFVGLIYRWEVLQQLLILIKFGIRYIRHEKGFGGFYEWSFMVLFKNWHLNVLVSNMFAVMSNIS